MQKSEIITIIDGSKSNRFTLNGVNKMRLFVKNGEIVKYLDGSKTKGRILPDEIFSQWLTLEPESDQVKFKREVSNCIKLMFNPPTNSRALDNYFENGEYTRRLVQEIKSRALKNSKLHNLLVAQYPTILTA